MINLLFENGLQFEVNEKVVSDRILQTMQAKSVSYGDLSKLTGIPKAALQRYATGATKKLPANRIMVIANKLNVSVEFLLGMEENPEPNYIKRGRADAVNQLLNQLGYMLTYDLNGDDFTVIHKHGMDKLPRDVAEQFISDIFDFTEYKFNKLIKSNTSYYGNEN